jgi:hypothetical protein
MECSSGLEHYFDVVMLRSSPIVARAQLILAGDLRGQSTQVVSQGRHHHSRWTWWAQPWSSGLNAPAGLPQNRHLDPRPARFSIHPVMLAVAACIPSSLGVRLIFDRRLLRRSRWIERPHPGQDSRPAPDASCR